MADQSRMRDLAVIHVGKKLLNMDESTYRDMIHSVVPGKRSAADLDRKERHAVIERMKTLGANFPAHNQRRAQTRRVIANAPRNVREDIAPQIKKIEALLTVNTLSWNYAHAMAKRMFGVTRVEWLHPEQLRKLIAALSYHTKRREVKHGHA